MSTNNRASFKPRGSKDRREAAKAAKADRKASRAEQRNEERIARRARVASNQL
jgi:hypothetical protein